MCDFNVAIKGLIYLVNGSYGGSVTWTIRRERQPGRSLSACRRRAKTAAWSLCVNFLLQSVLHELVDRKSEIN